MSGKVVFIMLMTVFAGLCVALTQAVSGNEPIVWDRVCINEKAIAYEGPSLSTEETLMPFKYWTLARWLATAPNGMEQILLIDGDKWWVRCSDFYPVYRVSASGGADMLQAYRTDDQEGRNVKPNGVKVAAHLPQGTLLGICVMAQALSGTYQAVTEEHQYGYVEYGKITPVGNPGPH